MYSISLMVFLMTTVFNTQRTKEQFKELKETHLKQFLSQATYWLKILQLIFKYSVPMLTGYTQAGAREC